MTQRIGEVGWVLDHLDDLDADFARFYRCDLLSLSGPRLFARAARVSVYGGVMSYRLQQEPGPEPEDEMPAGARLVGPDDPSMSDLIETG